MSKTMLSLAMVAAFAVAAPGALMAQNTSSDNPDREPPAGNRIPAAPDSPQHSGDRSSDASTRPGTSGITKQGTPSYAASDKMTGNDRGSSNPSQRGMSAQGMSAQGTSAEGTSSQGTSSPDMSSQEMSSQGASSRGARNPQDMSGQAGRTPYPRSARDLSGNEMPDRYSSQDEANREAWRRWHERMAQQDWMNAQHGPQAGWRNGPQDWRSDRYADRGDRDMDRDDYWRRNMPNQGRWNVGPYDYRGWGPGGMAQGPGPDYYPDQGRWGPQRYGPRFDQGWGSADRDWGYYERYPQYQGPTPREWWGRGPSYGENYYDYRGAPPDWRMQDRWRMQPGPQRWGDMAERGGRWHGDEWRDGSAMGDMSDRYSQPYYGGNGGMPDTYRNGPGEMGGRSWQGDQWQGPSQWRQGAASGQWDRYAPRGEFDTRGQRYIPRQAQITGERSPLSPDMEGDYNRRLPGTRETVIGERSDATGNAAQPDRSASKSSSQGGAAGLGNEGSAGSDDSGATTGTAR